MSSVSVYLAFMRNAFLKMLAYRARYYTGIFTYFIFVSVYYFIWQAIYAGQPEGARINGFSLPEMISYIAVGWIARSFYFSNIDDEIDDLVRSGQIGTYLLRPVDFQLMLFVQASGEALFRVICFSLPISIPILLVYPVSPPASSSALLCFCLSSLLGFLVLAALNFSIGILAFYFQSIDGIMRAKYNLVQLCSGLLLPLSFFPRWAQLVLDALPFKAIAYVPLRIYLGKAQGSEIFTALLSQLLWFLALVLAGRLLWSHARARLTLQGG